MGQQQLLLLVLGVVIVGLSIVMGVYLFQERFKHQQGDDLINRNVQIAQEAVAWRERSRVHGGGGGEDGVFDPLATNGMEILGFGDTDPNGEYAIATASGMTLEVVAVSNRFDGLGAYIRVTGSEIDSTAVRYDGSIALP
jgi:hypothetical protein